MASYAMRSPFHRSANILPVSHQAQVERANAEPIAATMVYFKPLGNFSVKDVPRSLMGRGLFKGRKAE